MTDVELCPFVLAVFWEFCAHRSSDTLKKAPTQRYMAKRSHAVQKVWRLHIKKLISWVNFAIVV
jgi:hypothetical protein